MKPTASARTPERAKLAADIERRPPVAEQLARAQQAADKRRADRIAERTSISRGRAALEIDAPTRSEIVIARVLGEPVPDQADQAEIKAAWDAAEAGLDAPDRDLGSIDREIARRTSSLGLIDDAIGRDVKDVVASDPATARLRDEYARTMARAARLWRSLRSAGVLLVNNFVLRLDGDDAEWVNALAALRENPDAPLPGIPPEDGPDAGARDGRKAA